MGVLIFLAGGLVFASENDYLNLGIEKYYNKIGLEKLWNGLPKDGLLAMSKVNEKMKQQQSYHFNVDFQLSGSYVMPSEITPSVKTSFLTPLLGYINSGIKELGTKVLGQEAQSATFGMKFTGDYDKSGLFSAQMSFTLPPQLQQAVPLKDAKIEMLGNNDSLFLKIPEGLGPANATGKYLKLESTQVSQGLKDYEMVNFLSKLAPALKQGERKGSQNVEGVNSYYYHFVIDKSKLSNILELDSEAASFIKDNPAIEVYISKKDHLVNKISAQLSINNPEGVTPEPQDTFALNLTLSDYNKAVTVTLPQEEEIFTGSWETLISGVPGSTPVNFNDERRKEDLGNIATALSDYYKDNKAYPVANEICRTNDKKGILYQSLVPKYLPDLPVDPKDPNWWYGYLSDGKTFKLWSLLENKNDPTGQQDGQYFKYILTNE